MTARVPKCARCRNHNQMAYLKGHKRYCKYKSCECQMCILTIKRRIIMAEQVKLSRYQAQDINSGKNKLPDVSEGGDGAKVGSVEDGPAAAADVVADAAVGRPTLDSDTDSKDSGQIVTNQRTTPVREVSEVDSASYTRELRNSLHTLMTKFECSIDCLPLLLIIVKSADLDIKKAINQILSAQQEVSVLGLYKEYLLVPDFNWNYHHMSQSYPSANYVLPYRPCPIGPNSPTTGPLLGNGPTSTSGPSGSYASHQYPVCMPLPSVPFYDHADPDRKPWISTMFNR